VEVLNVSQKKITEEIIPQALIIANDLIFEEGINTNCIISYKSKTVLLSQEIFYNPEKNSPLKSSDYKLIDSSHHELINSYCSGKSSPYCLVSGPFYVSVNSYSVLNESIAQRIIKSISLVSSPSVNTLNFNGNIKRILLENNIDTLLDLSVLIKSNDCLGMFQIEGIGRISATKIIKAFYPDKKDIPQKLLEGFRLIYLKDIIYRV